MSSNPDHSNSAPIVIESDDEADHAPAIPEPERMSLQDAINSASKAVLAKKLLEICEHNEASRELATTLPLPPLTPPVPQGTKRRAPPTEVIDRTCELCGRQSSNTMQIQKDCRYHLGELSRVRFHVCGRVSLSRQEAGRLGTRGVLRIRCI